MLNGGFNINYTVLSLPREPGMAQRGVMSSHPQTQSPPLRAVDRFFPEFREELRRLRRIDPGVDEICNDLEVIADLIRIRNDDVAAQESLDGLREEIQRVLEGGRSRVNPGV